MLRNLESITCICTLLAATVCGSLYPFGPASGDTAIKFNEWSQGNQEIQLLQKLPLLGTGSVSKLWVSSYGAVAYKKLQQTNVDELSNNLVIAPLFMGSQQGARGQVYVKQTQSDVVLFKTIASDVNSRSAALRGVTSFSPTFAMTFTWSQVASLFDSSLVNTFQLTLATDGSSTYAIFNYGNFDWAHPNQIYLSSGIFAVGDKMESCLWRLFEPSTSKTSSQMAAGKSGIIVVDVTNPLRCDAKFESPCGSLPRIDRAFYETFFANTGLTDFGWRFFAVVNCMSGFAISPDVTTRSIGCLYEPDYYEYTWELFTQNCIDLNATRRFQTTLQLDNLTDTSIQWFNDEGEITVQFRNHVEETIVKLLENVGLNDVATNLDTINNDTITTSSGVNESGVTVNFTAFVPTYVNQINKTSLKDKLSQGADKEINFITIKKEPIQVQDLTDKCLQACLCRVRFDPVSCRTGKKVPYLPPDACCGKCGSAQPYASSVKACCGNSHIYNPKKAVCCDGRVRKGYLCPIV